MAEIFDSVFGNRFSRVPVSGYLSSPSRFRWPRIAVGKAAAFEEGVELAFDELRQVGRGGYLCLGDERSGVLLHQAVQRGLLPAVALVVDRGASRRPLGLPADGLHEGLPK